MREREREIFIVTHGILLWRITRHYIYGNRVIVASRGIRRLMTHNTSLFPVTARPCHLRRLARYFAYLQIIRSNGLLSD